MGKVLFVIREGFDAKYIIPDLENIVAVDFEIVLETGKIARKRKLKRMISNSNSLLNNCLDILSILIYDKIMTKKMKKILGSYRKINKKIIYRVDDINDKNFEEYVLGSHIDLIIIYGTGILNKKTICKINKDIFNVHSSILPYYRNVHSDFWAYKEREFDKIGITGFRIDSGIDTGGILLQMPATVLEEKSLVKYKVENLKNVPLAMNKMIQLYFGGDINYIKQDSKSACTRNTPQFKDIANFLKSER